MLDGVADEYAETNANGLLNYTINLHPTHQEVGNALVDFLHEAEDWDQLGFIYSHDDSKMAFNTSLIYFIFFLEIYITVTLRTKKVGIYLYSRHNTTIFKVY